MTQRVAAQQTRPVCDGTCQSLGGRIDVHIVEYYRRAFPSKFQLHRNQVPTARFADLSSHFG